MKFVACLIFIAGCCSVEGALRTRRQVVNSPILPRPVPILPRQGLPRPVIPGIPRPVIPPGVVYNDVPIISYTNENNYDGSYKYSYETGNGIAVQEEGFLKNPGQPELEAQTARGTYSYTAPDGQVFTVNWYADETGFHAEGDHIPKVGGTYPAVAGVIPGRAALPYRPDVIPAPLVPGVLPAPIPQQQLGRQQINQN